MFTVRAIKGMFTFFPFYIIVKYAYSEKISIGLQWGGL